MTPLDSAFPSSGMSYESDVLSLRSKRFDERFAEVRATSQRLAEPLTPEDMAAQSMPDASPVKWHLAHTTWFFETFLLLPRGVAPFDPDFQFLFNSYYEALGERQPRAARGLITRPTSADVMAYRNHVDDAVRRVLAREAVDDETASLFELGLAHEQQHQELLLTDLLHLFAQNKLRPAYLEAGKRVLTDTSPVHCTFTAFEGGIVDVGHDGQGFAFDNEGPRHQVLLRPFQLADRLVVNEEWLAFMDDGGYRRPELWLSDGWSRRQSEGWRSPLYWEDDDGRWKVFGLHGLQPLEPAVPVQHVSYYEADAFARWRGLRLPTEAEWETASCRAGSPGAFLEDGDLQARPARGGNLSQMFGDVWEWTASPYTAYPGFRPAEGAVGEYNGKFMINQMILRGGSCVTPGDHVRSTYRNFFQPHQRWQFSGVRLASD